MEEAFVNFCSQGCIMADDFKQIYSVCMTNNLHGKGTTTVDLPVLDVQLLQLLSHGLRQHLRRHLAVLCPPRRPARIAVTEQ